MTLCLNAPLEVSRLVREAVSFVVVSRLRCGVALRHKLQLLMPVYVYRHRDSVVSSSWGRYSPGVVRRRAACRHGGGSSTTSSKPRCPETLMSVYTSIRHRESVVSCAWGRYRPEVLRRRATCRRGRRPSSFLIQPTCLPMSPGHGSDVVDPPKEAEEQRSVRLSDAAETSSSPRLS